MTYFFDPDCSAGTSSLPEEESGHAVKSLRLKTGDLFGILNGSGLVITACVSSASKHSLNYEIRSTEIRKPIEPRITLAVSPLTISDRFEFMVEKATELGVYAIAPIICRRTEKRKVKEERIRKIMISAIKQSGNPFLPLLLPLSDFNEYIATEGSRERFIAHCGSGNKSVPGRQERAGNIAIAIGPEGDFTGEEVSRAMESGFREMTLGNLTLRTETAAIAALISMQIRSAL